MSTQSSIIIVTTPSQVPAGTHIINVEISGKMNFLEMRKFAMRLQEMAEDRNLSISIQGQPEPK